MSDGDTRTWAMAEAKLGQWMTANGFATGHGENFDALLRELTWQVSELRQKLRYAQRQSS